MEGSSKCIEFCSACDNQRTGLLIQLVGWVRCYWLLTIRIALKCYTGPCTGMGSLE